MKIVMVGQGAFGRKHLDGLKNIDGVEVVSLVGGSKESTEAVAKQYGIPHWTTNLSEALARPGVEAAILTSPTQMHAAQAVEVMRAGKHVEIEIPIADSLADARKIHEAQQATRKIAMAGHTRRFNPSHQWVANRIQKGELKLQQLVVQTYFFRRKNINLEGKPRSWTDHLLWHHACHTVDLFHYQTGETPSVVHALQGPLHPELKIAMDMSIGMRTPSGARLQLVAVVQQRRAARHVLPLHLRQRHVRRALRRSVRRQGQQDRPVRRRRLDERHRAAGSRVRRGDPREARAEVERRTSIARDGDARSAGEEPDA